MPKFTPGPWTPSVTPEGQEFGAIISTAKNQKRICLDVEERCYGGIVVCESVSDRDDARLIAAAPEMYDAMAEFCSRFEAGDSLEETYAKFKAILAEIDGEET